MSISGAMSNALTGLSAAARSGEVVSSNIANVMTDGYARRELRLAAQSLGGDGGGVRSLGIERSVNRLTLQSRRLADSEVGNADVRTAFLDRAGKLIGRPGEAGSLADRITKLGTSLIEASSRPDSSARLQAVISAAKDLAGGLNRISTDIQAARTEADAGIARQVDQLNADLERVDALNASIIAARAAGRDANGLYDQRQALVDRIAKAVPVREIMRDNDRIALFTTGGAILLDGRPAKIGFAPSRIVTSDMTLASGALSGLSVNGQPIGSSDDGLMGGGSLGASFAVRDRLAPDLQAGADSIARDLAERFQPPGPDPTLAAGQAGLFTDAGAPADPLLETGLAGRLAVNAAADPDRGGQSWRLRDGLGAAAPGPVGNVTLLQALSDALAAPRVARSGLSGPVARSATGLAADLVSRLSSEAADCADRQAFAAGRQTAFEELQLQDGVNTDAELQTLLVVEKAYSANARVIQTMDGLLAQLIGLQR